MSYQVLARKWRPRTFRELVGQQHVLQALVNALDHNRLHHAYLFTGTRGVGKTTIARILAKCLNCESGVSSEPCGQCGACCEINEGRFVDLIEVDAASRTKVEDTRELLENVQYAPTRGRYKVYLIDEVHMLSNNSFNALLKTLEEPPPHVKFLLATTDPQKLPVTILSRCLQFHLKNMDPERIVGHLKFVLEQEMVPFEESALWQLGRSADGSMRDAMSLTDQAIAFGGGKVADSEVRTMLGTIDQNLVYRVLEALVSGDGAQVLQAVDELSQHAPDYSGALAELLSALHRVAIAQALPEAVDNSRGDREHILALAQQLPAEDVQLFYQTALMGRRDLPMSPDPRSGFEMVLLRMMAFRPQGVHSVPTQALPQPASAPQAAPTSPAAAFATTATATTAPEVRPPAAQNNTPPFQPVVEEPQRGDEQPQRADEQPQRGDEQPQLADEQPQSADEPLQQVDGQFDVVSQEPPMQPAPSPHAAATTQSAAVPAESVIPAGAMPTPRPKPGVVPETQPQAQPEAAQPGAGAAGERLQSPREETPSAALNSLSTAAQAPGRSLSAEEMLSMGLQPAREIQPVEKVAPAARALQKVALAAASPERWIEIYAGLGVGGVLQSTVSNCLLQHIEGNQWYFVLDHLHSTLYDDGHQARLSELLSQYFGQPVTAVIELGTVTAETPAACAIRIREEQYTYALQALNEDPVVQQLLQQFEGVLDAESVKPVLDV